jgi:hypothetical protein
MRRGRSITPLILALAVGFGASGCGSSAHTAAAPQKREAVQLRDIDQLRRAFDAHPGVPRLILLISPT